MSSYKEFVGSRSSFVDFLSKQIFLLISASNSSRIFRRHTFTSARSGITTLALSTHTRNTTVSLKTDASISVKDEEFRLRSSIADFLYRDDLPHKIHMHSQKILALYELHSTTGTLQVCHHWLHSTDVSVHSDHCHCPIH